MTNNIEKLKEEIALADKAKHAYDGYLEDFFAKERLHIFNRFCHADTDTDTLLNIKHAQVALDSLEQETLSTIETGKLANKMLADLN